MGAHGNHGKRGDHAKTGTEIDTALGREQAAGTIIYTAGYDQIKQKALDGSWVEVAK